MNTSYHAAIAAGSTRSEALVAELRNVAQALASGEMAPNEQRALSERLVTLAVLVEAST